MSLIQKAPKIIFHGKSVFTVKPFKILVSAADRYISTCMVLNKDYPIPEDPTNRVRDTMSKIINEETHYTRKGSTVHDTKIIDRVVNLAKHCMNHSDDVPRLKRCIEKAEREAKDIKQGHTRKNMLETLVKSRNVR